jgi:hypothetical protein
MRKTTLDSSLAIPSHPLSSHEIVSHGQTKEQKWREYNEYYVLHPQTYFSLIMRFHFPLASIAPMIGEARMAVRLRLALVFVVVVGWSKDLFVIFITYCILYYYG